MHGNLIDLTGKEFGRLTVIKRGPDYISGDNRPYAQWYCRCKCGREILARGGRLRNGGTQSCGCRQKDIARETQQLPFDITFKNALWKQVKRSARERNKNFELTKDQVWELSKLPCHYCGAPPSNKMVRGNRTFIYQGIDRKDNRKGYISGNCLPCCHQCNLEKGDRPYSWYKKFRAFWMGV